MINVQVMHDAGIIVVAPIGSLEETDFQKLASEIDAFTQEKGRLKGLLIHARAFPGWQDLDAFLGHMKFVRQHHKQIQRVAIATDSVLGEIGPALARHFVSAQLKHFGYADAAEAKRWLQELA